LKILGCLKKTAFQTIVVVNDLETEMVFGLQIAAFHPMTQRFHPKAGHTGKVA